MDQFIHDLGHGVRLLVRRPGFTAVAVLSLALGIGLNTTLFSVVNAVLFREHPRGRSRTGWWRSTRARAPSCRTSPRSYPDYLSIVEGTDVFAGVAAHAFVRGHPVDRRRARARDRRGGERELLRRARHPPRARPRLPAGGERRRGPAPRAGDGPRPVAAALRRPAGHRRPVAAAERGRLPGGRRGACRLHGRRPRTAARVLGARDDGRAPELRRRPGHDRQRPRRDAAAAAGQPLAVPERTARPGPQRRPRRRPRWRRCSRGSRGDYRAPTRRRRARCCPPRASASTRCSTAT